MHTFFRYLQIRHYVKSKISNFELLPEKHVFFDIFFNPPDSRHLISKFVCLFGSCTSAPTVRFKEAWEENLGVELSDDT